MSSFSWGSPEAAKSANSSNSGFFEISTDKDAPAKFTPVGQVYVQKVVWLEVDGDRRKEIYDPTNAAHKGEQVKTRFFANVYCKEQNDKELLIFEFGPSVFKSINAKIQLNGLHQLAIHKEGTGLKTRYIIDSVMGSSVTKKQQAFLDSLELHPLPPGAPPAPTPTGDDDIPF